MHALPASTFDPLSAAALSPVAASSPPPELPPLLPPELDDELHAVVVMDAAEPPRHTSTTSPMRRIFMPCP